VPGQILATGRISLKVPIDFSLEPRLFRMLRPMLRSADSPNMLAYIISCCVRVFNGHLGGTPPSKEAARSSLETYSIIAPLECG
jgi:hypothetical protein